MQSNGRADTWKSVSTEQNRNVIPNDLNYVRRQLHSLLQYKRRMYIHVTITDIKAIIYVCGNHASVQ